MIGRLGGFQQEEKEAMQSLNRSISCVQGLEVVTSEGVDLQSIRLRWSFVHWISLAGFHMDERSRLLTFSRVQHIVPSSKYSEPDPDDTGIIHAHLRHR